jgi:hypothetical protein
MLSDVPIENTDEVGAVLFQGKLEVAAALARFKFKYLVAPSDSWYTRQFTPYVLFLPIKTLGATPSPCPTVALLPVPV